MKRVIRLTIQTAELDDNSLDSCPSGKDIVHQLEADFNELGMEVKVTLDDEYEE